jgi:ribonuclease HI
LNEDLADAGALVNDLEHTMSQPLGKGTTVFQAKVYAILSVLYYLFPNVTREQDILIFTDSQAAIKAIENPNVSSKLIEECKSN